MSRIEELINRLCPDGVEFKKLGEVCDFVNGFAFKSSLFKNIGLPIIRITNINGISINMNDLKFFDAKDYNINLQAFKIEKGDILIAMSGATTGKIGCYNNNNIAYINQRVGKFVPNNSFLENRYLFHFLRSKTNELYIMAGGGAQPNLSSNKLLNNFSIPIPPLEIQQEIVRILDNFTELTNELTNELTARKKQYEYYRDKLLTFDKDDDKVKWMKLGEVADFRNGKGHEKIISSNKNDFIVVNSKFISSDGKIRKYSSKQLSPLYINDILIVMSDLPNGKALGKTFIITENNKFTLNQRIGAIAVKDKDKLNTKFLSYCLNRNKQLLRYDNGVDQTNLKKADITSVILPIPSLEVQEKIVSILDRFDQLCNDLTAGLPAEIEARRKQYEYYRDKLLTFKEKKA